jgi:hypothetical protein
MSNTTSRMPDQGANRKADDFRLIKGLTKTAKAKLHTAGILTFAQLAAMSPHEVIVAIGSSQEITAEHILREDWIGQASKLAAPTEVVVEPGIEPPAQQPIPEPDERRTSFALELKLNEDNTVRQTRVMYVESEETDAEENWPGWDETRLLGFIARRGKITSTPKVEMKETQAAPATGISIEERLNQLFSKSGVGATANAFSVTNPSVEAVPAKLVPPLSSKLEVFAGESGVPSGLAVSGEPYCVRVRLDSTEVKPLAASELAYRVTVYARHLASKFEPKQYLVIGESEGVLAATDELVFTVNGAKLSQGAYRLHAAVRFNALGTESASPRRVTTLFECGLLQIY